VKTKIPENGKIVKINSNSFLLKRSFSNDTFSSKQDVFLRKAVVVNRKDNGGTVLLKPKLNNSQRTNIFNQAN